MSEITLGKRQRQLRNLVVMAMADGSIGQREVNLVADRCFELGLGEDSLREALKFGLHEDAALELPTDESEKFELMKDLLRMMAADGKLEESEKRLFAIAAAKMQVGPEQLERVLASLNSQSEGTTT